MSRKPFDYQQKIIDKVQDLPFFLLNMACGTGKTATSINVALHKGKSTMIIAPKNVLSSWKDELMEDGVSAEDIWVYSAEDKRKRGEEQYLEDLKQFLLNGKEL